MHERILSEIEFYALNKLVSLRLYCYSVCFVFRRVSRQSVVHFPSEFETFRVVTELNVNVPLFIIRAENLNSFPQLRIDPTITLTIRLFTTTPRWSQPMGISNADAKSLYLSNNIEKY